jgi:YVTN family beta-propeller protein
MQFAILGTVEATSDGRRLEIGGPKQRSLLAILLLHANDVVSRDTLIEGLWGDRPPGGPRDALDSYISRLRRVLGDDRVSRRSSGYALRVEPGELDVHRFEKLVAEGDLTAALAVWRGPALADLVLEPFARDEAARLDARRLDVLEEQLAADIAEGGGPQLVGELERLVHDHPFRERFVAHLMVALYRSGRQAVALEVYRRARRLFADELGLEPGPQLAALEQQILAHDPRLEPEPPRRAMRSRRRFAGLGAAALVIAIIAAAGLALFQTSGATTATAFASVNTSRLVHVSGSSGRITAASALPSAPAAVAVAAGSLWLAQPDDNEVVRVDPSTGNVDDRIPINGEPGSITSGGGAIWAASTLNGTLHRIDPDSDSVTQTVSLGQQHSSAVLYAEGELWVADATDNAVIQIDPTTGAVSRTFSLDVHPTALAVGREAIWVADDDAGTVTELDRSSGQAVATINVGGGPAALELGEGALWVANSNDSTLSRIDPETTRVVATIPVGSGPSALAAGRGSIWVANQYAGTVSRIDPKRNAVTQTVDVGGQPETLAVTVTSVWVGSAPRAGAHRGGTLVLATSQQARSIDPAIYEDVPDSEFIGLAYDSLVAFASTSGPQGLRLVPDLALAVPTATASGTTYAFHLRPRIRYSDGRLVRASDFRRSFERLFRVHSPGEGRYLAIVGAPACQRSPATCDLAPGIVTDDRNGTVVFHLSKPDPDFLVKLTGEGFAAPMPVGVPDRDAGYDPLPGTGPYRIERANRSEIRFVRNPYFHEWSHAAQPQGNPDSIVWRFSKSHAQTISWVLNGTADWSFDQLTTRDLRSIRTRRPEQLRANPIFAAEFLPLNTHIAPFDDVRVRRALNYALDRNTISAMYGGSFVATPACQPIVPDLAGYHRYCPYTSNPSADGAYHGPDLRKARRLVDASGTRGMSIDVQGITDESVVPRQEARYVASVLRSLGYRVQVHWRRYASISSATRRAFQLSTDGDWLPDYPDASAYLPAFFSCGGGLSNGYVCDRTLDTMMTRAESLQSQDPLAAARVWRLVDRRITNRAYWVPTVADRLVDLVSARVRNYQFQPVYGFLADQAWLR